VVQAIVAASPELVVSQLSDWHSLLATIIQEYETPPLDRDAIMGPRVSCLHLGPPRPPITCTIVTGRVRKNIAISSSSRETLSEASSSPGPHIAVQSEYIESEGRNIGT